MIPKRCFPLHDTKSTEYKMTNLRLKVTEISRDSYNLFYGDDDPEVWEVCLRKKANREFC